MKPRICLIVSPLVMVGLALLICSCGAGAPQPAPSAAVETGSGEPYRIGVLVSITGGASMLGVPERNTVEMLEKEIEATGGIRGPDGLIHPVEVFIYDTESEETKAVLAAKRLIEEDRVSILLGPSTSGEALAIVDTVEKAKIPMIAMAASKMIVEPVEGHKWIFKVAPNDSLTVRSDLEWLKSDGVSKLAWLSSNNAYGDSGRVELEKQAPEMGMEIVASERMDAGDTDMTAQLTKIRGTDAEALIIYSVLPELAIAAKNRYDLGMELPLIVVGASANVQFIELAGPDAAEGARTVVGKLEFADQLPESDAQKAVIQQYNKQYSDAYGTVADQFGGHAYDAFQIAIRTMGEVGGDRAAIRDKLEALNFAGCSGIFQWSAADHAGMAVDSLVPIQVTSGKWQMVKK